MLLKSCSFEENCLFKWKRFPTPAIEGLSVTRGTCLEVGLEDVRGQGYGPVEDPSDASTQEDLRSAELRHAEG